MKPVPSRLIWEKKTNHIPKLAITHFSGKTKEPCGWVIHWQPFWVDFFSGLQWMQAPCGHLTPTWTYTENWMVHLPGFSSSKPSSSYNLPWLLGLRLNPSLCTLRPPASFSSQELPPPIQFLPVPAHVFLLLGMFKSSLFIYRQALLQSVFNMCCLIFCHYFSLIKRLDNVCIKLWCTEPLNNSTEQTL